MFVRDGRILPPVIEVVWFGYFTPRSLGEGEGRGDCWLHIFINL
jgi:hypothetical protein